MSVKDAVVPSSYGDLITLLNDLPIIVRETRRRKGVSLREAAKQIGVSFSTIARIESQDASANLSSVIAVLRWVSS